MVVIHQKALPQQGGQPEGEQARTDPPPPPGRERAQGYSRPRARSAWSPKYFTMRRFQDGPARKLEM